MLTLTRETMEDIAGQRQADFAGRLLNLLQENFSALLVPLPAFVKATMVCNGLDRAASWGFTMESTLGQFVALQCASSADFDRHPTARDLLQQRAMPELQRMEQLTKQIPMDVWEVARSGADIRAWFDPDRPDQRPARLAARVCSELPELCRRFGEAELRSFFECLPGRAHQHGINVESGMVVLGAALVWFGDRLDQLDGPGWACSLFFAHPSATPPRLVAGLRHALLVDSGRLL